MRDITIYAGFVKDFAGLEKSVQSRVKESLVKFRNDELPGSHVEKIHGAANGRFRSVRVTKSVRAIVIAPTHGKKYTLLKVLPHDDAYAWARRSAVGISADGRLEIVDPDEFLMHIDGQQIDAPSTFVPVPTSTMDDLNREQDNDAPAPRPIGREIESDGDLDSAIENTPDQLHQVTSDEDFERILEYPFDTWRIYLHPSQRRIVDAEFRGPARITGGPGTGKTVVCVHRARRLAEAADGYVLLVTFTKSLADATERAVDLLVDDPALRNRIKVRTIDGFARRVFEHHHGRVTSDGPNRFLARPANVWRTVVRDLALDLDARFLQDEFVHVVLAQQISSEEQYLGARRVGRGQRLGASQRKQVWAAVRKFDEYLVENDAWTFETLCREAARLLAAYPESGKSYRYVVIDESQDLSPDHWRLVRAAVPANVPNNIFIAGDVRQRIYHHRVSLKQIGIDITGRSRHLTLNHRTSEEILQWSMGILDGAVIDDLDGEQQTDSDCHALFRRYRPTLKATSSVEEELDYIVETIQLWRESGVDPAEIGVAVRELKYAPGIRAALEKRGVPVRGPKSAAVVGVTVASMHSMKGLEFRCMVVMRVGNADLPPEGSITPPSVDKFTHDLDIARERQLLFVACTRAREDLLVTWIGEPSTLLPSVQEGR